MRRFCVPPPESRAFWPPFTAVANQQEQQAGLDAFNAEAGLTLQDTWEEPIITAKVGPMNPVDGYLMDHPTLGGILQGVADFLGIPQRINVRSLSSSCWSLESGSESGQRPRRFGHGDLYGGRKRSHLGDQ